jgi:hypothetical protein
MPCLRRPGCLDGISSFDSAGVVHNNVYSTEIVQVGSKIAGIPLPEFGKRLDGHAGFRGFDHSRQLIGPAAVLKRDAATDQNGVKFDREPPSACAGCRI